MKKILLIVAPLAIVALISTLLYMNNEASKELEGVRAANTRLTMKLLDTEKALKKFDGIEASTLLEICANQAADVYSEYIRDNSFATKSGSVTTFHPRSADVIVEANENRVKSEKDCQARFASSQTE